MDTSGAVGASSRRKLATNSPEPADSSDPPLTRPLDRRPSPLPCRAWAPCPAPSTCRWWGGRGGQGTRRQGSRSSLARVSAGLCWVCRGEARGGEECMEGSFEATPVSNLSAPLWHETAAAFVAALLTPHLRPAARPAGAANGQEWNQICELLTAPIPSLQSRLLAPEAAAQLGEGNRAAAAPSLLLTATSAAWRGAAVQMCS